MTGNFNLKLRKCVDRKSGRSGADDDEKNLTDSLVKQKGQK